MVHNIGHPALWWPRENGIEGGEGGSGGKNICKIMADSHCFRAEMTQHCKAIFLQLKNKFDKKVWNNLM